MRVLIELVADASCGRRIFLAAGQRLQVGRTEWADVAVPGDLCLSSVHFVLESDHSACTVRDLESANGTFVNGQRVDQATLRDGDEILAGRTTFRVSIEDTAPGHGLRRPRWADRTEPLPPGGLRSLAPPDKRPPPIEVTRHTCESHVTALRGVAERVALAEVAGRLASKFPIYLVVDVETAGDPQPAGAPTEYLIDWLPEEVRAKCSPRIVTDPVRALALAEKRGVRDALVAAFSSADPATVLDHLRRMAGVFCRPAVLAAQIEGGLPDYVIQLLAGIDAVLIEGERRWTIYAPCNSELRESSGPLGLVENRAPVGVPV